MQCNGCRAKRCYKHILSTYSIHSSAALTVNYVDRSSNTWHGVHQTFKDTYAKEYTQLKVAVKHGVRYPLVHRLAYYASAFASTTPINKAVKLGFYDVVVLGSKKVSFRFLEDASTLSHRFGRTNPTTGEKSPVLHP